MIFLVLATASALVSIALFVAAALRLRQQREALSLPPVAIALLPAANENDLRVPRSTESATRRFVAIDAIAACRDSVNRTSTQRYRASFIEASVAAQLLSGRGSAG